MTNKERNVAYLRKYEAKTRTPS